MYKQDKYCHSGCEFFRCRHGTLMNSKNKVYCRWVEDDCSGPTCNYSTCIRNRLLPRNVCGMAIRRKTSEDDRDEENLGVRVKVRPKLLKRFEQEIY